MQIVAAKQDRIGDRSDRLRLGLRGLRPVDRAQQQNRSDRPDGAQADKAERVRLGIFIGTDGRNTDAERHDKRHRHRPRRYAAGVKRHGEDPLIGQERRQEHQHVKHDQQQPQRDAEQDTHHAQHEKDPDADGDRQNKDRLVDIRHVRGQHLQIRLRHGDGNAEQEAHRKDQPKLA